VSIARLYVLRATYLLLVVGLGATMVPPLIDHAPMARGVIPSLLGGVWLLAFIGLKYPLQMLPLLMFEFAWKTIWLLAFGLPQWFAGQMYVNARSHAFLLVKGGRNILRRSWQWYRQASGNARTGRPGRFVSVTVTGAAARLQCREFGAVVVAPDPEGRP
jgi:hypothetical protein